MEFVIPPGLHPLKNFSVKLNCDLNYFRLALMQIWAIAAEISCIEATVGNSVLALLLVGTVMFLATMNFTP
ncbi:hypothetical protein [Nostoc favosum]|uniref:Uncharacterized protein n=1 Tax=Nostoc favosum CHAB5714 TaxID=2780399 RepID=A0ABS8IEE5_9NOSO|nr:hypothetical protein [Nostoc favosum]MCC5602206.1 hypothetical protein [Nostoc favosum CHAB5714]